MRCVLFIVRAAFMCTPLIYPGIIHIYMHVCIYYIGIYLLALVWRSKPAWRLIIEVLAVDNVKDFWCKLWSIYDLTIFTIRAVTPDATIFYIYNFLSWLYSTLISIWSHYWLFRKNKLYVYNYFICFCRIIFTRIYN